MTDIENFIYEFYYRSLQGTLKEFEFNEAFAALRVPMKDKLAEHAICDEETFIESQIEHWVGTGAYDSLQALTVQSDYVYFGQEEIAECLAKGLYQHMQGAFFNIFDDLKEYFNMTQNVLTTQEATYLFDNIIHYEHTSGLLLDGVDTESIKEQAEEDYKGAQYETAI